MRRRVLLILSLTCLSALPAPAQDLKAIERQLEAAYKGKVLTLRHFDSRDHIEVEADGQVKGKIEPAPWTTHGKVEIKQIEVRSDQVQFHGQRVWVAWNKEEKKFRYVGTKHGVRIRFKLPRIALDMGKLEDAFLQVFLAPGENLADFAPAHWRPFLRGETPDADTLLAKEGNLSFPTKQKSWSFEPPPAAEAVGVSGRLVLLVTVNHEGRIENPVILEPLGFGMDEAFIDSVKKLEFEIPKDKVSSLPIRKPWEIKFE